MSLTVVDDPRDKPEWIRETLELLTSWLAAERAKMLERVARAKDAELMSGTDDDWGLGQVAVHLLLVERGVCGIALRLASGQEPGATGQPRPAASAVTRDGIAALAKKAEQSAARLVAEFPAEPDATKVARHPFYGDMNAFGWLLTLPNHYRAHTIALDRGTKSAL